MLMVCGVCSGAAAIGPPTEEAASPWMSEEAMRAAFIGNTLDGHYGNGLSWSESYFDGGRLAYLEPRRSAVGDWSFRGAVFCTFYDNEPSGEALSGGCWRAIAVGTNCYEFYLAATGRDEPLEGEGQDGGRWSARGWRRGEPATCQGKPSV
jgi:hypothetical protein